MGLFAYDIAAAFLIARESLCIISDYWGVPHSRQANRKNDLLSLTIVN
jgi:fructose-1,6-bisphosphatase/inositol monophosphatase family enzyme